MREVLVETPNVGWEDVGGLNNVRDELQEAIEWPLKHPESFKRMGIRLQEVFYYMGLLEQVKLF